MRFMYQYIEWDVFLKYHQNVTKMSQPFINYFIVNSGWSQITKYRHSMRYLYKETISKIIVTNHKFCYMKK